MGARIALGAKFEVGIVDVICTFLDDSSMFVACGSDAGDVADLGELGNNAEGVGHLWHNQSLQRSFYHGSLEFMARE